MFVYLINLLMWLGTFGLIGTAIYVHYMAVGVADRNVSGLVIGALILGCWSANLTYKLLERNRHDDEEDSI